MAVSHSASEYVLGIVASGDTDAFVSEVIRLAEEDNHMLAQLLLKMTYGIDKGIAHTVAKYGQIDKSHLDCEPQASTQPRLVTVSNIAPRFLGMLNFIRQTPLLNDEAGARQSLLAWQCKTGDGALV